MKAVLARFGCIASLASCFRRRFGLLRWSSASDKSCGNCGSGPARTSTEVIFPCSGIVVDMWDIEVRSVCGGRPSSVCEMRCCGAGSIRTSAACTVGGCPNGSRGCIITRPTYLPTFEDMIHGIHHWPGSAPSRGSTLPPSRPSSRLRSCTRDPRACARESSSSSGPIPDVLAGTSLSLSAGARGARVNKGYTTLASEGPTHGFSVLCQVLSQWILQRPRRTCT